MATENKDHVPGSDPPPSSVQPGAVFPVDYDAFLSVDKLSDPDATAELIQFLSFSNLVYNEPHSQFYYALKQFRASYKDDDMLAWQLAYEIYDNFLDTEAAMKAAESASDQPDSTKNAAIVRKRTASFRMAALNVPRTLVTNLKAILNSDVKNMTKDMMSDLYHWVLNELGAQKLPMMLRLHSLETNPPNRGVFMPVEVELVLDLCHVLMQPPHHFYMDFILEATTIENMDVGSDEQLEAYRTLYQDYISEAATKQICFPRKFVEDTEKAVHASRTNVPSLGYAKQIVVSLLQVDIFQPFLERNNLPRLDMELVDILNNTTRGPLFLSFATTIHNPHPVNFYFDTNKCLAAKQGSREQFDIAYRVYKCYLESDAPRQVPCPHPLRKRVGQLLGSSRAYTKADPVEPPRQQFFNPIVLELYEVFKWLQSLAVAVMAVDILPSFIQHTFYLIGKPKHTDEPKYNYGSFKLSVCDDDVSRRSGSFNSESDLSHYSRESLSVPSQSYGRESMVSYYSGRESIASYYVGRGSRASGYSISVSQNTSVWASRSHHLSPRHAETPSPSISQDVSSSDDEASEKERAPVVDIAKRLRFARDDSDMLVEAAAANVKPRWPMRSRSMTSPDNRRRNPRMRERELLQEQRQFRQLQRDLGITTSEEALPSTTGMSHAERVTLFRSLEGYLASNSPTGDNQRLTVAQLRRRSLSNINEVSVNTQDVSKSQQSAHSAPHNITLTAPPLPPWWAPPPVSPPSSSLSPSLSPSSSSAAKPPTTQPPPPPTPPPQHALDARDRRAAMAVREENKPPEKSRKGVLFNDKVEFNTEQKTLFKPRHVRMSGPDASPPVADVAQGILKSRRETVDEILQRVYREREAEAQRLLSILQQGAILKKYNTLHSSDRRYFEVSEDGSELSWEKIMLRRKSAKGKKRKSGWFTSFVANRKSKCLAEAVDIKYGTWWSDRFTRYNTKEKPPWLGFTLFFPDRTLDIVCSDELEVTTWFLGLQSLIPLNPHYLSKGALLWKRAFMKVEHQADQLDLSETQLWAELLMDARKQVIREREQELNASKIMTAPVETLRDRSFEP